MIRLFTYAPDRLNLNGDQGNVLVLQKNLEWAGVRADVVALNSEKDLRQAENYISRSENRGFLLVGHGSYAAMKTLASQVEALRACMAAFNHASAPVLVVGSSFEALVPHTKLQQRVSRFQEVNLVAPTLAGQESSETTTVNLFGYLNSHANLPAAQVEGSSIFTLLHGPVLTKSIELQKHLLKYLGAESQTSNHSSRIASLVQSD